MQVDVQLGSSPGCVYEQRLGTPQPLSNLFLFAGSKIILPSCRELIIQKPLVLCLGAFGSTHAGMAGWCFCFVLQDGAHPDLHCKPQQEAFWGAGLGKARLHPPS